MTTPPSALLLTQGDKAKQAKVWPWFAGTLVLIALDQVTKILIRHVLGSGRAEELHSVPFIGKSLVRLTFVQNPGIAFGVDVFGLRPLLIFGCLASIVLAFYLYRLAQRRDALRWPVMLFLAGAIGNSIDRALFGQVTDFIDVDMPDFVMQRFAVFNVADSCVSIGIVLLAISVIFGHRKTVKRESKVQTLSGKTRSDQPSSAGSEAAGREEHTNNPEINVTPSDRSDSLPTNHRSGTTAGAD